MSAPYYQHHLENQHLDERDSNGEADSSEGNASEGNASEENASEENASEDEDEIAEGASEPMQPRGSSGDAEPEPKRRKKIPGKVMTMTQFNKTIGKSWRYKTFSGVIRAGKDKSNHGLTLRLDDSVFPPVHRLHCSLCSQDVTRKIGQHLGGDKHWDKHNMLMGKEVAITHGDNEWIETTESVRKSRKGDGNDIVNKLRNYAGGRFRKPTVREDSQSLLNLLPERWGEALARVGLEGVSNISLDLGRRPCCWRDFRREHLCEDPDHFVDDHDIGEVVTKLQGFGDDNRAGIDGQLHRISCIHNNKNEIIGLTIRVGRHVEGVADMIRDFLEGTDKNILFLGERGSGKTSVVRDSTQILSGMGNVFVIDTSNEIAGDGNIPHPCVGDARRMMVKSPPGQAKAIIECLENHAPSIVVIDEIGEKEEVEAVRMCRDRGVRLIASARVGDLRSLVEDEDLRDLFGGLETTKQPPPDDVAEEAGGVEEKMPGPRKKYTRRVTRASMPTFDVVVELKRGRFDEWHVITDAAKAVADILLGRKYEIQKRLRCINSGEIFVKRIIKK